ncbi:MAG: hypothetical protein GF313_02005 [Caldithrix sp.]|nr:hypothetical protein [Caldithrix sp.]
MKIIIKKLFDGSQYIAYCENLTNCYAQAKHAEELQGLIKRAIVLYKDYMEQRGQTLDEEPEHPIIKQNIKFDRLSSEQIGAIFKRHNYYVEYADNQSILMQNSDYPFNHVHLPNVNEISPIIVKQIFGKENVSYVRTTPMRLRTSSSV